MTPAEEMIAEMRKQTALLTEIRDALKSGARSAAGGGDGARFGNYGRSKGAPVFGASMNDLTYYRTGCVRTLSDSSKSRFHDRERQLLAAIDAEIVRQGGTVPEDAPAPEAGSGSEGPPIGW